MTKPFISGIDTKKLNLLNQIHQLSPVSVMGWVGPNYVTGTLSLILTNQQVFITNEESPTLATGNYICDVYAVRAQVTLPSGTVARVDFDQMAKYGYSNWQQKVQGVAFQQSSGPSGNVFDMVTYSVLPRYNIIGQPVNVPALPAGDLTGLQFVYSYFE